MRNRAKEFVLGYWRTAVVAVLILVFTLRQVPPELSHKFVLFQIPHFDKAVHFFMFMLMAMATAHDFVFRKKENVLNVNALLLYAVALPTVYGGVIELIQQYCTVSRTGDWLDLAADFLGAAVYAAFAVAYNRKKNNGK
jgi:hypothetical protein